MGSSLFKTIDYWIGVKFLAFKLKLDTHTQQINNTSEFPFSLEKKEKESRDRVKMGVIFR